MIDLKWLYLLRCFLPVSESLRILRLGSDWGEVSIQDCTIWEVPFNKMQSLGTKSFDAVLWSRETEKLFRKQKQFWTQAWHALGDGGVVCGPVPSRRLNYYRALLRAAGFREIQAYAELWFTTRPWSIVPLWPSGALKEALQHVKCWLGRVPKNSIALMAAIFLAKVRLFVTLVRSPFVVARKSVSDDQICSGFAGLLKRSTGAAEHVFSLYSGTCKGVLAVFLLNGKPAAYVRLAVDSRRQRLLENEVQVLRWLARYHFEHGSVPFVIKYGRYLDSYYIVESTVDHPRPSRGMNPTHLKWLCELFNKTAQWRLLRESGYWRILQQQLDYVFASVNMRRKDQVRARIADVLVKLEQCGPLPFGLCQRECSAEHFLEAGKKLFVVDWEHARREYPPYFDLFHYLLSIRPPSDENALLKRWQNLFFKPGPPGNAIRQYSKEIGLDDKIGYFFLWLYVIDQLMIYSETPDHLRVKWMATIAESMCTDYRYAERNWLGGEV